MSLLRRGRVVLFSKSVAAAWLGLIAIDLVSRASFLAPRLLTARGIANYAASSAALFIVLRLLATLPIRPRNGLFVLLVAIPMTAQFMLFRSLGELITPTDFVMMSESPKVVLQAAGAAGDRLGALAIFVCAVASLWLMPKTRQPLKWWRALIATTALGTTIAIGAFWWWASPSLEHPEPAFASALLGLMQRAEVTARGEGRLILPVPPALAEKEKLPNIVLILGESLAASHLTLYGYERDTTPRLQAIADKKELIAFRDAVVMGPHTRTSLPYIITGTTGPDPSGRVFHASTVMEYAKARGYHTAFVSAQEESWGALDALLREGADTFRPGIQFATEVDVLKGSDDLVVLEKGVLPAIQALEEPFFLIAHMDGSHVPYSYHSPPSHKVFAEDGVNSMAAYDNTIRVTDEYVDRVFAALRARDPNAWMFFTSDHGQALGEGGAFYNRGYQTNVVRDPLLVFPPPNADHVQWDALADSQTSACDLTPTILHLMKTRPAPEAPMDCTDLLLGPPKQRIRVVSAYTPAYVDEPTMLLVMPDGERAVYDLWRGTVTTDDGRAIPIRDRALPPEIQARLTHH